MAGNQSSDQQSIARLKQLPEVWPDATQELTGIFRQIPEFVGVPGVHLAWRLLANFPSLLQAAWPALACDLASTELAQAAAEVRRHAFIAEAVGAPSHKAFRGDLVRAEIDADFRGKISNFNDLSQHALSRLLVVMALLREASNGHTEARQPPDADPSPPGIVAGAVYVPPLGNGDARGKAAEVLQHVAAEHGLPLLDDYFRSLARISEYLGAAWNAIRPLAGDRAYSARVARLSSQASAAVRKLPAAPEVHAFEGLSNDQQGQALGLLDYLVTHHLPTALVDVTLIKALTEGPDRATALPFADAG